MPLTTVPVTVRLSDFGGADVAGVVITARLSDIDIAADDTFVSTDPVEATTDANGVAVLDLFPNAMAPGGLGTRGTTVRVTAAPPGSKPLRVTAAIPNAPCNLGDIAEIDESVGLTEAELALIQVQAAKAQAAASVDAAQAIAARIYPGSYLADPLTRPNGDPSEAGDLYITTTGIVKMLDGEGDWNAINVDMASLAASTGSSLIGHSQGVAGAVNTQVSAILNRVLTPEDFGAVGNANFYDEATRAWYADALYTEPANDDYMAFKGMYDEMNRRGGGYCKWGANKRYWFKTICYRPAAEAGSNTFTVNRYDGRTCSVDLTTLYRGTGNEQLGDPSSGLERIFMLGWDGFEVDGNGSSLVCNRSFRVESGQLTGSASDKAIQQPFDLNYCSNGVIKNMRLDGEWSKTIITNAPTGINQGIDYAFRTSACKNLLLENIVAEDFKTDFLTLGHAYVPGSPSMEGAIVPDTTSDTVYQPSGECADITLRDCYGRYFGRNGMSLVGVHRFRMYGGEISFVGINRSELPVYRTTIPVVGGSDPDGSYQIPGANPKYAVDFEPDRNSPNLCTDLEFHGVRFEGSLGGIMSALGDAKLIRLESAFNATSVAPGLDLHPTDRTPITVDPATDTFTCVGHGLAPYALGFTARLSSTVAGGEPTIGAGPGKATGSYWIIWVDADHFKLATSAANAALNVAIDLTDTGSGTLSLALTEVVGTVDTTANTFRKAGHGFTGYEYGNRVRIYNVGGALPAPLQEKTDYWLVKIDADSFKFATSYANAMAGITLDLTTAGTGTQNLAFYRTLSCVGDLSMYNCYMDHPSYGGTQPFAGSADNFRVIGGRFINRRDNARITVGAGGFVAYEMAGVKIEAASTLLSYTGMGNGTKSVAISGASVDTATDTIAITGHGLGNYEFTPVFLTATTLPTPLRFGVVYYVIKVDDDHFKLALTEDLAKAGTAIDLTATGAGTLSVVGSLGSTFTMRNNEITYVDRARFFSPGDIDLVANTVSMRGNDRNTGEAVILKASPGGTLPAPLVAGTSYNIISQDLEENETIQFAANITDAGNKVPIVLTTTGTGVFEMRTSNVSRTLVGASGPGLKFHDNNIFIPWWVHIDTLGSHQIAGYSMTARGAWFGNSWHTDLSPSLSPARNFLVGTANLIDGPSYRERYGDNVITTMADNNPVLYELDTRVYTGTVSWTPASVNANTTAAQTVTVTGLRTTDLVVVNPPGGTNGLGIAGARVSATDTLEVRWSNSTAGGLLPPAGTYRVLAIRQSS